MKFLDLFRPFGLRTTIASSLQEVMRPGWFKALSLVTSFIVLAAPLRAQFVYVTTYGNNTVLAYSIGSNGALTPVPGSPVATGNLPQSVTVDPSGRFAYVANWYDNNGSAYSIGSNGALTPVSGSPFAAVSGSISVTVDPTGRFAYVANYNNNTVSTYSIGSNGALTPLSGSPVATGAGPHSVKVDPSGRFAYVGGDGQRGNGIAWAYTIGPDTNLTSTASVNGIVNAPASSLAITPLLPPLLSP